MDHTACRHSTHSAENSDAPPVVGLAAIRAACDLLPHLAWSCRPDGYCDYLSRRWVEFTGLPEIQHHDRGWLSAVHPDDRDRTRAAWEAFVAGEDDYDVDYRLRRHDGEFHWFKTRGVLVSDAGRPTRVFGTTTDIDDQKRAEHDLRAAERELRDSERRFRQMADTAPVALWLTDAAGSCTFLSREWYEQTGQTEQESLGLGWTTATHPDDQERAGREFLAASTARGPFRSEYRLRTRDGSYRWVIDSGRPRYGSGGEFLGMVGAVFDVEDRKRAEERFRAFMDHSPAASWVTDSDGVVRFLSATYARMFQVPAGDLVGAKPTDLYPEEFAREYVDNIRTVARTGTPLRTVERAPKPDGSVGEFLVYKFPLPGTNLVGGVAVDVTDQRRAEEALRASELEAQRQLAELKAIYATAPLGMCVLDRELRYLRVNPELAAINGVSAEAHIGRTVREIVPSVADQVEAFVGRVFETNRGERIELRGTTPLQPGVERVFDEYWFPIPGPAGTPEAVAVIVQEITDRKRLEEALRASEEQLRSVTDAARVGLVMVDEGHRYRFANRAYAEVLGLPSSDVVGLRVADVLAPVYEEQIRPRLLRAFAGDRVTYELKLPPLPGRGPRFCAVAYEPRTEPSGERLVVVVIVDITERLRAEEALKDADRRKDEFLAILAHELRNPLAPIRNGLQVMRLSGGSGEAAERARAMMDRQLGHMVRLIDDLLDISRISRGKLTLRRERVFLTDAVTHAVETARPLLEAAGHTLAVDLPPEPVYLDADLTRVAQVVANLLTNAAKYTPPGGHVWLRVDRRDDSAVVTVRDTGVGIPAESLPRIFDMFSQVDRTLERTTGGLGIGLALVKGLVEMHVGSVTAESEGAGMGSTFVVTLPLKPTRTAETGPPGGGGNLPSGPARRVLVVDDNRDSAESMAEMLRLLGHLVRTAHDGVEAVEAVEAYRPQVVLMDIGMPRMNGYEATRRIRERPWARGVTVVALTGWGQDADREQSAKAGCDGHLVKPVQLADLVPFLTPTSGQ